MKLLQFILLIFLVGTFGFAAESKVGPQDKEEPVNGSILDKQEDKFQESSLRIFGFTILIGLIGYGYIWWNRKKNGIGQGSSIRVVAVKPLGQREKVAVLEIMGEKMVVGVTANHISLLRSSPDTHLGDSCEVGQKE